MTQPNTLKGPAYSLALDKQKKHTLAKKKKKKEKEKDLVALKKVCHINPIDRKRELNF